MLPHGVCQAQNSILYMIQSLFNVLETCIMFNQLHECRVKWQLLWSCISNMFPHHNTSLLPSLLLIPDYPVYPHLRHGPNGLTQQAVLCFNNIESDNKATARATAAKIKSTKFEGVHKIIGTTGQVNLIEWVREMAPVVSGKQTNNFHLIKSF